MFNQAKAGYVVLTTKHHEGYTLWESEFKGSHDVFVGRDIVGDLANALRKVRFDKIFEELNGPFDRFHAKFWESGHSVSISEGNSLNLCFRLEST